MRKTKLWAIVILVLILSTTVACSKQNPKTEGLPDLFVKDAACMGGDLYVTIGNQGDGALPDDWTSLASLYIDGISQADILLNKPTSVTKGSIEEPGGLSHYLIPYDISSPIRVDIFVDYNESIKESNEYNNEFKNIYLGPCLLPDLAVEKIYLNEDKEVVVVVKNKGPGRIPENIWIMDQKPECSLTIFVNDEEEMKVSARKFDPRHDLNPVSGIAAFPSGITLPNEETTVTAVIDCSNIIQEQDEENNTLSVKLNPGKTK